MTARCEVMRVVRARENNLRNVTVAIPKRRIAVFTGVSGSGKSSLVFDTIAAESQRQLNETFPAFVRNRLPHYGQPDADALENLSPAIIVDQKRIGGNARSTVGTATHLYALLRLLFLRIGTPIVGESSVFSFNHPNGMCLPVKSRSTCHRIAGSPSSNQSIVDRASASFICPSGANEPLTDAFRDARKKWFGQRRRVARDRFERAFDDPTPSIPVPC